MMDEKRIREIIREELKKSAAQTTAINLDGRTIARALASDMSTECERCGKKLIFVNTDDDNYCECRDKAE